MPSVWRCRSPPGSRRRSRFSRGAFVQSVEEGGCLIALDAEPVRGQALVAFSPGLMARLLQNLLGAPPNSETAARPVTEIEMHILGEIFESFGAKMNAAWKPTGIAFRRNSAGPSEVRRARRRAGVRMSVGFWRFRGDAAHCRARVPCASGGYASRARRGRRSSRARAGNDSQCLAPGKR